MDMSSDGEELKRTIGFEMEKRWKVPTGGDMERELRGMEEMRYGTDMIQNRWVDKLGNGKAEEGIDVRWYDMEMNQ